MKKSDHCSGFFATVSDATFCLPIQSAFYPSIHLFPSMRSTYTLALLCSLLLAARAGHAQRMRLGVKAGLNASTYAGANLPDTKYRLGPAAGVMLQVPIGAHVDLQPEFL
jgi:hypothetical protein